VSTDLTDERLPVWEALSEFFLDTELDETDHERIATVLARSEYTIEGLEEILIFEVYPPCKWNMLCVAGEWAMFGEEWIMERIAPRKDKRPKVRRRPLFGYMFKDHWKAVAGMIKWMRERSV
jgi:hypothetical protein